MNDHIFDTITQFRYEHKFHVPGAAAQQIEKHLRLHPALFRRIYHPRRVNNIYFDDLSFSCAHAVIDGISRRAKVRIRWYGETFGTAAEPYLEIKAKSGTVGGKLRFALAPLTISASDPFSEPNAYLQTASLPETIRLMVRGLRPVLLNTYTRDYFLSAGGNYRITIDDGMHAYPLGQAASSFLNKTPVTPGVIVEIKCSADNHAGAESISRCFPFPLTKHSKYLQGLAHLYMV